MRWINRRREPIPLVSFRAGFVVWNGLTTLSIVGSREMGSLLLLCLTTRNEAIRGISLSVGWHYMKRVAKKSKTCACMLTPHLLWFNSHGIRCDNTERGLLSYGGMVKFKRECMTDSVPSSWASSFRTCLILPKLNSDAGGDKERFYSCLVSRKFYTTHQGGCFVYIDQALELVLSLEISWSDVISLKPFSLRGSKSFLRNAGLLQRARSLSHVAGRVACARSL